MAAARGQRVGTRLLYGEDDIGGVVIDHTVFGQERVKPPAKLREQVETAP